MVTELQNSKKNLYLICCTFSIPIESSWRDEQLSCISSSFNSIGSVGIAVWTKKYQHFISGTFSIPIESSWRDEQLSCLSSSFKSKSRPNRSSSAPLTYSKLKKPCQYCAVEYVGLKNHENKCHKKPNKTVKTNSSSHNLSYFVFFFFLLQSLSNNFAFQHICNTLILINI